MWLISRSSWIVIRQMGVHAIFSKWETVKILISNVPLNLLQFWYHMSQFCPTYSTDIWADVGSFMMKRSNPKPLFCDCIHIIYYSAQFKKIREFSDNFALNLHFQIIMLPLILSHPSGIIDIKCPTWRFRILILSHIACPT